ncbi:MAG: putative baseplate assembly protein [Gammaproteobacteria bacterium]|nr:putative baseplate assembly protein [Gammaproteobacteria bacterium]
MNEACGCCAGVEPLTPEPEANRPGLSAIVYRAGTYATFLETMIARLSTLALDVPMTPGSATLTRVRPLAALTTREPSDPSIALLDAWAIVADVLTFYQERIANEGYLPTAVERRSIVELAKLIGYRLRPGVSASVSLAFNAALDFNGVIPQGTRAQSIPSTGESAQYFETSDNLPARDTWNLLAPRVRRPQLITPPTSFFNVSEPIVTGADMLDTVYFGGTATQLKAGDALLFVFSGDDDQQFLRQVESVNPQGDDKRTEVMLSPVPLSLVNSVSLSGSLRSFIAKAAYLFPASDLAQEVAGILKTLINNVEANDVDPTVGGSDAANFIRGAIAQVRERRDIAVGREFTRVSAWLDHLLWTLEQLVRVAANGSLTEANDGDGEGPGGTIIKLVQSSLAPSPLGNLASIIAPLALSASVQPANAQRLLRPIAQSFSPQSDTAPRLLAALKPQAATTLYRAWTKVETPTNRVDVQAVRTKAALFAHNFAGKPTVTNGSTTFAAPTISSAWGVATDGKTSPPFVALDATYDQIKPGSWVVIDRPDTISAAGGLSVRTYHRVIALKTATMDAGANSGFTAKTTLLTLDPSWLGEMSTSNRQAFVNATPGLRGTIVYAQTEPLPLTEEPLDTDVEGDTIELDRVYDGLDAGRWIIVSGDRTDIPNVSAVSASELVMLAGVAQGARAPLSVDYPLAGTPFSTVYYTTNANAFGDRLVVGKLSDISILGADVETGFKSLHKSPLLPLPTVQNQQYRDQVQLAPGVYANAYVPTERERFGSFSDFAGLLVDPVTGVPFSNGNIADEIFDNGLFAWRIASQPLHTVLTLANALAYKYDTRTIKIYGNVVKATHGQTIGEVLGDGDTSQAFQKFPLRQSPLTYVSAPTPAGTASTLNVRVNEIDWHEADNIAAVGSRDRAFVTDTDDADVVTTIFGNGQHGARLPTGKGNIKATYRYGIGKGGNVRAWQISQLATHPLGVQGVINPLAATGGADRDTRDQARRNAPLAVIALDRLLSLRDYEDFAGNYAGIGKASANRLTDGRRQFVHLTVAGKDDIPIDRNSDLYRNLVASLELYGDPQLPVAVCIRRTKVLVIAASIQLLPDYHWEAVEPVVRAAVLGRFSFDSRELGQAAFLSEAIEVMQNIEGVSYVNVERFDSVAEDVTAAELAALADTLALNKFVPAELAKVNATMDLSTTADTCERILPAELVYMTPDVPETLNLKLI